VRWSHREERSGGRPGRRHDPMPKVRGS
jgi:hypothetical protein